MARLDIIILQSAALLGLWALALAGLRRRRPGDPWTLALPAAFIMAFAAASLLACAFRIFSAVRHFDGYFANGAFQLLNALRRIDAGQRVGVDFQFFHGPLVPYLHWPLYRLSPGLGGVELARHGLSFLTYLGTNIAFFRVVTGSWRKTAVLTVGAVALAEALRLGALLGPQNSSVGVRSFLPVLFIAWRLRQTGPAWVRSAVGAGLLAASMLSSTEHGLAIFAAYVAVGGAWELFRLQGREGWGAFAATVALALALFCGLGILMTGSGGAWLAMLRFNYVQVPMDQFWYFGAPPNPWVEKLSDFRTTHFLVPALLHAGIIAGVLYLGLVRRSKALRPFAPGLALAVIYGIVGSVGYLGMAIRSYMEPLLRMDILVGGAVVALAWHEEALFRQRVLPKLVGAFALALALRWPHALMNKDLSAWQLAGGSRPETGLSSDWAGYEKSVMPRLEAEEARLGRPLELWSTYSTLVEMRTGRFHPHTDYIIHALGPEARASYLADFVARKPDVVQTLRSRDFVYEEWLRNTSWAFYEAVLKDYEPWFVRDHSVFWRRAPKAKAILGPPVELLDGPVSSPAELNLSRLPAGRFWVLEARYALHNPWGWVPVFGKMPRYFLEPVGAFSAQPVSFPPYETRWSFPVVRHGAAAPLAASVAARGLLPGAALKLEGLTARALKDSAATRLMLLDLDPADPEATPYPTWKKEPR